MRLGADAHQCRGRMLTVRQAVRWQQAAAAARHLEAGRELGEGSEARLQLARLELLQEPLVLRPEQPAEIGRHLSTGWNGRL